MRHGESPPCLTCNRITPWLAAQSWDVRGCGRAQDARESGMLGLDTKSPAFRLSFPVCCLSVKSGGGEPARQQDAMPRPHHLSIDRHLTQPVCGFVWWPLASYPCVDHAGVLRMLEVRSTGPTAKRRDKREN